MTYKQAHARTGKGSGEKWRGPSWRLVVRQAGIESARRENILKKAASAASLMALLQNEKIISSNRARPCLSVSREGRGAEHGWLIATQSTVEAYDRHGDSWRNEALKVSEISTGG